MFKIFLQFLLTFLIELPAIILGLFLVPIGLLFLKPEGKSVPYTKYPEMGSWKLIRLPKWLYPWDNSIDGVLGDRRGWWANETKDWNPYVAMWWWMAVRNPANQLKRFILTCDVSRCLVSVYKGQEFVDDEIGYTGFQILQAERDDGKKYYQLYYVRPWGNSTRGLVIQMGFKFKLKHNDYDFENDYPHYKRFKGFTFEIAPYKDIT